jgi:glycosyltransferase involved in cell wall biosynthesis
MRELTASELSKPISGPVERKRDSSSQHTDPAPVKLAIIGNYTPRKCGIATFTADLFENLHAHFPHIQAEIHALDDALDPLDYPHSARPLERSDPEAYAKAARRINESGTQAVWLQHEFGIFGGEDGEMVCDFVNRIAPPLIVTFHTVLSQPSPRQRAIMRHLIARSSQIMVMSAHSRDLLAREYGAPHDIISVIEHGAPDRPFGRQEQFRQVLGHDARTLMMTFGLLGPGKGIENVIEALPAIVQRHPSLLYRIVGATHPNLVAEHGESYRESLMARVRELGLADYVEWDNRFLETDELLDQIEACDLYVTPYPGLQQSTSGTLSYAVALGKAVISTPYVHARELLGDGVGVLVEPDSPQAIGEAVCTLLDDPDALRAIQQRAYDRGRKTIWPEFARRTADLVHRAAAPGEVKAPLSATPGFAGIAAMCDATGILQHGNGVVPDRDHGYCLDDNARALMLMTSVRGLELADKLRLTASFASFVQHAWNEDRGRFRNFMHYDRSWAEEEGSEDSNGRALWALGHHAAHAGEAQMRAWATQWYTRALPHMRDLGSPRAIAFTMLGAAQFLKADPDHADSRALLEEGTAFLLRLLGEGRRPDWAWFEAVLGYDNPRLPQALIESALITGDEAAAAAGLETLAWIAERQMGANGQFRPIGSDSFGKRHAFLPFDQQPLEAQAAIEAAASALDLSGDGRWIDHAQAAYRWFFGANDRGAVLADLATGRCRDGITPRGANENCGAESCLAFQLSYYCVIAMAAADQRSPTGELRFDRGKSHTR